MVIGTETIEWALETKIKLELDWNYAFLQQCFSNLNLRQRYLQDQVYL